MTDRICVSTFSIVARDSKTGDLGIAVQSKFFGVGAVVSWARAGVGAIATQALANVTFGERGLALLQSGWAAQQALEYLLSTDPEREVRQIGLVDRFGNSANFTGAGCSRWAGGKTGAGYCVQGNILVSQDTTDAMADAFESTTGPFPHRLISALEAGQIAGGDSRGQQSASIYVVRERAGYGGGGDRLLDLHVEDHSAPIEELRRLYELHGVYFRTDDVELEPISEDLLNWIAEKLNRIGYIPDGAGADQAQVLAALQHWAGNENLEERLHSDDRIDTAVLTFLDHQAGRSAD